MVKLGFTGVYIIFLFLLKTIDCGYSLEPPRRGGSNEYTQSMFWAELWKISEFFIWKFSVLEVKFSVYLNRCVFVMLVHHLFFFRCFGKLCFVTVAFPGYLIRVHILLLTVPRGYFCFSSIVCSVLWCRFASFNPYPVPWGSAVVVFRDCGFSSVSPCLFLFIYLFIYLSIYFCTNIFCLLFHITTHISFV